MRSISNLSNITTLLPDADFKVLQSTLDKITGVI